MNILYYVPYSPNLVRVRPYNLIRALLHRGHSVTLASLVTHPADHEDLQKLASEGARVVFSPMSKWQSLINCVLYLPSRYPLQAVYSWNASLVRQLKTLIAEDHFDVIHVEHLRGARVGIALRNGTTLPVVWDSVDNISHLFRQARKKAVKASSRLITSVELFRTPAYERWLCEQFDHTLVTSPIDRQAFLNLKPKFPERISVLPNGVDLDFFTPGAPEQRHQEEIVVSGKMSYHANISMVIHLVQDIMPLVWNERPKVKLIIAGKDPPQTIKSFAQDPRITVTGEVPDIRLYLQHATVAVAPITYGAGIQNKVLEAMACATPVVASPQAVQALNSVDGKDLLVAESPQSFAEKILLLLNNPLVREEIGQCGRRYIEQYHSWNAVAQNLEEVYEKVIENQPQSHRR
ncbi:MULTISPECIES: glycosyltransferase [Anaerolinea]|uniref:glycosyltransferase n=1 Tax=Anaerolinea TaxID=233189 RepID=UPI00262E55D4|nr:glycosyltransferase [Anaerolinea thermophila]